MIKLYLTSELTEKLKLALWAIIFDLEEHEKSQTRDFITLGEGCLWKPM